MTMRSTSIRLVLCGTLAPVLGPGLLAQQWLTDFEITGRGAPAIAYDVARATTVLFGGYTINAESDETWLLEGGEWRLAKPANWPPRRWYAAMAYDVARQRTVLFGGKLSGNLAANDTWEFDGTNWTQVFTANAPPARSTALAYDIARGRVVLFGGEGSAILGDTWEYDGTNWTQVAPATAPSARSSHALAYDAARGRTVLFGTGGGFQTADTWEFDGTNWTQIQTATVPPWRRYHGMAFDVARSRIVMFGGWGYNRIAPNLNDTWEYDGVDWTLRSPTNVPTPQWNSAVAYDVARQRTVLFGNSNSQSNTAYADTWTWDGTDWTFHGEPPAREQPGLADDPLRGRTILFGGSNSAFVVDTWEHDGTNWQRTAATAPARVGHTLVFDPVRARTMFFGGGFLWATYDDTWEYDGTSWAEVIHAVRPPPRANHAMAWDAGRRRMVLFGGETGQSTRTFYNDTWEHDGTSWHLIPQISIAPSPRSMAAMVYETARNRILLFGGTNNTGQAGFSDTWIYDGSVWTQLAPATVPAARHRHGLVYDPQRGRTLMFGGEQNTSVWLGDTWEFDGTNWAQVSTPTAPSPRSCPLVFQYRTGRVMSFGGTGGPNGSRNQFAGTSYFVPAPVATFTRHGRGCPGSAGIPVLDTIPPAVPALGTSFPLQLSGLPATPGVLVLAFGFDLVRWGIAPLPLDLGAFGLPGCDLWIGPTDGLSLVLPYAGTASHSLALPAAPALAGLVVGVQALVLDPAASSGLGAVTNAGILRLY